ncbi:hypothetical protein LXL04_018314 [Taraxacum kok-saghyz]
MSMSVFCTGTHYTHQPILTLLLYSIEANESEYRKGIPNNTTTTNPNPNQFLPEAEAATTIEEAEATMASLKAAVKQWKQRRWKQRATKMKSRKMEAASDEIISSIRW